MRYRVLKPLSIAGLLLFILYGVILGYEFHAPIAYKHERTQIPLVNTTIEVRYVITEGLTAVLNSPGDAIHAAIVDAAKIWSYFSTKSNINLVYGGSVQRNTPASFDEVVSEAYNKENTINRGGVIAPSVEDPDCTGPACTFIWAKDGSPFIRRFDIQINTRNFMIQTGDQPGGLSLNGLITHFFGHAIGLTHCASGDMPSQCSAKMSGTGDPGSDSVMYRLFAANQSVKQLGDDDIEGSRNLYGELSSQQIAVKQEMQEFADLVNSKCPCPLPGEETNIQYKPSTEETNTLTEHSQKLAEEGLYTASARKRNVMYLQEIYNNGYARMGKSAEAYLLAGMRKMDTSFTETPSEFLENLRQVLYININEKKWIIDNTKNDLDPIFYRFINLELKMLIQIRRCVIDEQIKRI